MRKFKSVSILFGLLLLCLIVVGCKDIIVSGTFILVEDFDFTAESGFYFYQVDITDEEDWADHKDDIDFVDAVGVEFFITSTETGDVTFNAYIDDYSGSSSTPTEIPDDATQIIENLIVSPGITHITYKQSLDFLTGLERMKELSELGQFDYYGESTGNEGTSFIIDSARVIITFSASE